MAPYLSEPLHVLISHKNKARRLEHAACHVCGGAMPKGAFIDMGGGLHVSSPEFTFLQLASVLEPAKLMAVGFELCGSYSPSWNGNATQYKRYPLSDVSHIGSFLAQATAFHGVKLARSSLPYVLERSASPRETALALLLSLPERFGGYGIKQPVLNHRITVPKKAYAAVGSPFFICDLYWPQYRLAVEYDSSEFHEMRPSIAKDSARRNALSYLDVQVVSVTNEQIRDSQAFDHVARLVGKATEKRFRDRCVRCDVEGRRGELRRMLL